jgi:hypothetical protein
MDIHKRAGDDGCPLPDKRVGDDGCPLPALIHPALIPLACLDLKFYPAISMSTEIIIVPGILAVTSILFIRDKFRPDVVAILMILTDDNPGTVLPVSLTQMLLKLKGSSLCGSCWLKMMQRLLPLSVKD